MSLPLGNYLLDIGIYGIYCQFSNCANSIFIKIVIQWDFAIPLFYKYKLYIAYTFTHHSKLISVTSIMFKYGMVIFNFNQLNLTNVWIYIWCDILCKSDMMYC